MAWGLRLNMFASLPAAMSRRSLRPQLNQIRGWVRQGRTDAWIAHQLEVTVQQIQAFKREHDLEPDGDPTAEGAPEEVDLRAEDDAVIAEQLEAEAAQRAEEEAKAAEEAARKAAEDEAKEAEAEAARAAKGDGAGTEDDDDARPRRRRTRTGRTRKRTAAGQALEGTFDHGEEGYGLWLDPAVEDDPVYAEHWAGHRPVEVTIEEDQIVIRRAGGDEDDTDG
jgi:hypothetical protein